MAEDARGGWGALAGQAPRAALDLPGAELRSASSALLELPGGGWAWTEEQVHRAPDGAWLLVRLTRRSTSPADDVQLFVAVDAAGLVAQLRRGPGLTPGLVEVLGRAGIEVGLEPGDVEED